MYHVSFAWVVCILRSDALHLLLGWFASPAKGPPTPQYRLPPLHQPPSWGTRGDLGDSSMQQTKIRTRTYPKQKANSTHETATTKTTKPTTNDP